MARYATSFEEHVDFIGTESPHALILEWWRRLSLAIPEYLKARGLPIRSSPASKEKVLAADPSVGPEVAAQIRELRLRRNAIAHEETKPISPDDAAGYARKALNLIWLLAKR